jgi:hypothetical protein
MENGKRQSMYIDKYRYKIQEQKEVPVWYTGMYRSIYSTGYTVSKLFFLFHIIRMQENQFFILMQQEVKPISRIRSLSVLIVF